MAPVPLPPVLRLNLSSVASASWALVIWYRRCRLTIARAIAGCAATISTTSVGSTSASRSRSWMTSRNSATRRVSSWVEKNVASTPNTSVMRSRTATVSGRTSCSIWLR